MFSKVISQMQPRSILVSEYLAVYTGLVKTGHQPDPICKNYASHSCLPRNTSTGKETTRLLVFFFLECIYTYEVPSVCKIEVSTCGHLSANAFNSVNPVRKESSPFLQMHKLSPMEVISRSPRPGF